MQGFRELPDRGEGRHNVEVGELFKISSSLGFNGADRNIVCDQSCSYWIGQRYCRSNAMVFLWKRDDPMIKLSGCQSASDARTISLACGLSRFNRQDLRYEWLTNPRTTPRVLSQLPIPFHGSALRRKFQVLTMRTDAKPKDQWYGRDAGILYLP